MVGAAGGRPRGRAQLRGRSAAWAARRGAGGQCVAAHVHGEHAQAAIGATAKAAVESAAPSGGATQASQWRPAPADGDVRAE